MTGNSFAQEWPGQWGRARKAHRRGGRKNWMFAHEQESGPGAWVFAREHGEGRHGRPSEEDLEDLIAMRRMRGGPVGRRPMGRRRRPVGRRSSRPWPGTRAAR